MYAPWSAGWGCISRQNSWGRQRDINTQISLKFLNFLTRCALCALDLFLQVIGAKPHTRELNGGKCLCVTVHTHVRSDTDLIHYARDRTISKLLRPQCIAFHLVKVAMCALRITSFAVH